MDLISFLSLSSNQQDRYSLYLNEKIGELENNKRKREEEYLNSDLTRINKLEVEIYKVIKKNNLIFDEIYTSIQNELNIYLEEREEVEFVKSIESYPKSLEKYLQFRENRRRCVFNKNENDFRLTVNY